MVYCTYVFSFKGFCLPRRDAIVTTRMNPALKKTFKFKPLEFLGKFRKSQSQRDPSVKDIQAARLLHYDCMRFNKWCALSVGQHGGWPNEVEPKGNVNLQQQTQRICFIFNSRRVDNLGFAEVFVGKANNFYWSLTRGLHFCLHFWSAEFGFSFGWPRYYRARGCLDFFSEWMSWMDLGILLAAFQVGRHM